MYDLRKFVAPEFVFGIEARKLAGRYAKNLGGGKVLLVADAGIMSAGWLDDVKAVLEAEGLPYAIFSQVSPNPRDFEVMAGSELYLKERCDLIVAVGGGSVMDCAKGIGIVSTNGGHVLDYEGVDKIALPMPPLICIPTTAGTSADVSQFAIINNSNEKVKIAIISKAVVPDVALIDPETLITMDPYLTACTGIDALVHAIEAFVSNASSPFTDLHALEAIRNIVAFLPTAVSSPQDLSARTKVMQASLYAGLAFSNASLGSVHAMAHSLGGYLDLPHGECNALLLPYVVDYNFDAAQFRYNQISDLMGSKLCGLSSQEAKKQFMQTIFDFRKTVGVDSSLSKKGVTTSDVSILACKAIHDPCNATNPRNPTREDLESVYREAI